MTHTLFDPRFYALVLLYAFARLLKTLLEQTHENTEIVTSKIDESAIALCRVCGNFPTDTFNHVMAPLLIKHSLFWAGIVLKKSLQVAALKFYFSRHSS